MRDKIAFCGDFAIARCSEAENFVKRGVIRPFNYLQRSLPTGTYIVANLECAITEITQGIPFKWVNLAMGPELSRALEGLDLAVLGNNHAGDFGERGVEDTIRVLSEKSIASVGIGKTVTDAMRPAFIQLEGGRVGVASLCCPSTNSEFIATHSSIGVAPLGLQSLKLAVQAAKKECDAVVAFLHWGNEQVHDPVTDQLRLARHAIDCGANAVIGCHSHTIQSFEKYKNAWIFYGLGNFFFDPGSVANAVKEDGTIEQRKLTQEQRNRESLVVTFSLSGDEAQPLTLDDILPVKVMDDWNINSVKFEELSFNLLEINMRLKKFVEDNKSLMLDRSEPAFRAMIEYGRILFWYEAKTIEY